MRTHLEAVQRLIADGTGRKVYLGEADGAPRLPYFVLWCSPGLLQADEQDGQYRTLNEQIGLTGTAATMGDVLDLMADARQYWLNVAPTVPGWHPSRLALEESRPVQIDRDVKLPVSGRYPAFGVDLIRLVSDRT